MRNIIRFFKYLLCKHEFEVDAYEGFPPSIIRSCNKCGCLEENGYTTFISY